MCQECRVRSYKMNRNVWEVDGDAGRFVLSQYCCLNFIGCLALPGGRITCLARREAVHDSLTEVCWYKNHQDLGVGFNREMLLRCFEGWPWVWLQTEGNSLHSLFFGSLFNYKKKLYKIISKPYSTEGTEESIRWAGGDRHGDTLIEIQLFQASFYGASWKKENKMLLEQLYIWKVHMPCSYIPIMFNSQNVLSVLWDSV